MKFSLCLVNRKRTASFGIVGLMLAIAPLGLMMALANTSAQAQTPASVSSASVSTTSSPADWTQFLRDNMQRWNPYETVLGVSNVGSLQLKWKSPLDNSPAGMPTPVVAGGVVYSGSDNGNVYALNASTGTRLWSFITGKELTTSLAIANGVVYVGSWDGNLYALDASTGAKLWSYNTGNAIIFTSPALANGVVYVGNERGNFYALNANTGSTLWTFATASGVSSSPAVANGVFYLGSSDGNLYALNAATGAKLWSFATGAEVLSSPAVANGVVYIGSLNHNVYALNATTGSKLWSFATGGLVESSPAVANGVVYVGSDDSNVYALNASTGAKLWSFASGAPDDSSPAVANGVVYVGSDDGNLHALNSSTGAKLWSYPTGSAGSSPAIVDGVVYSTANSIDPSGIEEGYVLAFSLGSDLFLRAQPSSTTVHQGDLLTYTFPVWNLGPENAVHEVLNTQVPAGTTFNYIRISGTPGLGTCTTPKYLGTGQIICHENASMAPNTTWTVRLTVRVTAPSGTVITENAATLADTPDPNPANNTATVSIKVQ